MNENIETEESAGIRVNLTYNDISYSAYDPEKLRGIVPDEVIDAAIQAELNKPRYISKFVVLQRVIAAGKFPDAMVALGGPGNVQYELWSAAQELDANDPQVRGLIEAIGLDPAEVLA
jgi:hypothetical protein